MLFSNVAYMLPNFIYKMDLIYSWLPLLFVTMLCLHPSSILWVKIAHSFFSHFFVIGQDIVSTWWKWSTISMNVASFFFHIEITLLTFTAWFFSWIKEQTRITRCLQCFQWSLVKVQHTDLSPMSVTEKKTMIQGLNFEIYSTRNRFSGFTVQLSKLNSSFTDLLKSKLPKGL